MYRILHIQGFLMFSHSHRVLSVKGMVTASPTPAQQELLLGAETNRPGPAKAHGLDLQINFHQDLGDNIFRTSIANQLHSCLSWPGTFVPNCWPGVTPYYSL